MSKRQKADYSKYEKYRMNKDDTNEKKSGITRIIVAIILAVLILAIGNELLKSHQIKKEQTQIEKQLKEVEKENESLEEEKENLTTREYIEKIAREKLGLFYPDEIVLEED